MKKHSISMAMLALVLVMGSAFMSCDNGSATGGNVFLVDVSEETDWDYMAFGEDGSSVFFNVNKTGDTPTTMYYKPKKNSDDGFTFLLKDNGLPDKMIHNNHIICFENYSNYKFDVAVIYPNNTIEYHYGIETDINFSSYRAISLSGRARSLFGDIFKHVLGVGTCAVSLFYPPAAVGCGTYIAKEVVAPLLSGNSEIVVNAFIDLMGCVGGVYFFDSYTKCVTNLGKTAYMLTSETIKLVNQKSSQVDQATSTLNKYTVTFHANGGTGTPPAAMTTNKGASIKLPYQLALGRSDYFFGGWNTKADGTGTTYNAGSSYTPTSSIVLYAKWDIAIYTVTFHANGGSGTPPAAMKGNKGYSITLPGGSGLSKKDYTFGGWNTKADGTGTTHRAGYSFGPSTNDITLYAVWNVSAPAFVPVTHISGVPSVETVGTPIALTGTVEPSNATNNTITWTVKSAGTTGATISRSTLSTTATGTVTVTATIANGKAQGTAYTQDFTITISAPAFVPVTNISGVPSGGTVGTPIALTGTVEPSNATYQSILWSVNNAGTTGATISGSTLNTTAAGTVTVRAVIVDGTGWHIAYTQSFTITISSDFVAVASISDVPTAGTAGTPLTLTGTVAPATATNKTILWSVKSAGTTGATISGSTLSTTAAGTVTVTATIANGAAQGTAYTKDFTITISSNFVAVTNISGVPSGGTVGTPIALTSTVEPSNATNKTIVWTVKSAGSTGASISGSALSTTAAGTVTITATIANGTAQGTPYTKDFSVTISASGGGGNTDHDGTPGLAFTAISGGYSVWKGTVTSGAVVIPSTYNSLPVTEIAREAFYLTYITSVTIPSSVTTIGASAFSSTDLTSVTIPTSVTSIGALAFQDCTRLTGVTIPAGVTSIGNFAFSHCTSLTSVTISSGVTTIGDSMFSLCTSLTSVTIPSSVTSIGGGAFSGCESLRDVTIPSSVTSIGQGAFGACYGLTSIIIPSSVTSLDVLAFSGWTSSQTIYIQGHASQAAADAAWDDPNRWIDFSFKYSWRTNCNARIIYQG